MNELVRLEEVSRTYPGGVRALDKVDLSVEQGELLAIVGPSGSGKSTLLQLVGTLDRPTEGRIWVRGHDISALSDRQVSALRARSIGFVFQQFHLAAAVNVLDNVADGLLYAGVALRQRRALADEAIAQVGLSHRLTHRPSELSGGERQRVAIARAIVGKPDLLLADEPTGNLDSASGQTVLDILKRLHRDGTTVLIITHDHDLASAVPRQVNVFDGRIVSPLEPSRLRTFQPDHNHPKLAPRE